MIHSSSMTYPFIWDPFFSYPNRGIVEKNITGVRLLRLRLRLEVKMSLLVRSKPPCAGRSKRLPMVPMLPHKLKPGESRPMPTSHLAPIWSFASAFPLRRSRSGGVFPPRKTESVSRLVVHPQCMDMDI